MTTAKLCVTLDKKYVQLLPSNYAYVISTIFDRLVMYSDMNCPYVDVWIDINRLAFSVLGCVEFDRTGYYIDSITPEFLELIIVQAFRSQLDIPLFKRKNETFTFDLTQYAYVIPPKEEEEACRCVIS